MKSLIIKSLYIKNFRIFGEKGIQLDFDGGFTHIVANNGAGKSSIWLALKIALGGEIPRSMSRIGEEGLIHYPQKLDSQEASKIQSNSKSTIKVILNNRSIDDSLLFIELDPILDIIAITTTITSVNKIKYEINGKEWKLNEYREALRRNGINPEDPLLFLEQLKTTEILTKGPLGLLEAYELSLDIITTRDNLDAALASYYETLNQYNILRENLIKIREEFDNIKTEYQKFQIFKTKKDEIKGLNLELNLRKFLNIKRDMDFFSEEIKNFDLNYKELLEKSNKTVNENETVIYELNEINDNQEPLELKMERLDSNQREYLSKKKELELEMTNVSKTLNEINELKELNFNELEKEETDYSDKFYSNEKLLRETTESIETITEDLRVIAESNKSLGPKKSKNFLELLSKNKISSELLINSIILDNDQVQNQEALESILGNFRWSVIIKGNSKILDKALYLAKTVKYYNYIFLEEPLIDLREVEVTNLNIKFKTNSKITLNIIDFLTNKLKTNFLHLDQDFVEDIIGRKFAKLDRENLFINIEKRSEFLKNERNTLLKNKNTYSDRKKQIQHEIDRLHKILEKKEIILMEKDYEKELNDKKLCYDKLKEQEKNTDDNIQSTKIALKMHQARKEILLPKKQELRSRLYEITSGLKKNREEYNPITAKIEDLKPKFSLLEKFKDFIINYKVIREENVILELITTCNNEVKKLGEINEEIDTVYFNFKSKLEKNETRFQQSEEDLKKKIEITKNNQEQHKNFIDNSIKEVNKNLKSFFEEVKYEGRIKRYLYEKIRRKGYFKKLDEQDVILGEDYKYGLDLEIKKPSDLGFYSLFEEGGGLSYRHSGGQKEVSIMAFLFAVQKTMGVDAKFYLLDEPIPHMDHNNSNSTLKLFDSTNKQILLFTPKPLNPIHLDEIISFTESQVNKISKEALAKLKDLGSFPYFKLRKN